MARKSVKTEKTSKRGKGDVKQSVKVSVKIGETKPKRKRAYRRKAKGESDLARAGSSKTFYGNLPPPPPQQIVYTPQLPPAFESTQKERNVAGLLEDVKRERTNLLEDIKRETTRQIQKAQGAEQRGELARIGWVEPVSKPPTIMESIETTAPSFEEISGGMEMSKPLIQEISSKIYEEPKTRQSIPLAEPEKPVSRISEIQIPKTIQLTAEEKMKRSEQAKARRGEEGRAKIYDETLSQYGFPAIRGSMSQEDFAKQIISIYEAVNSGGKRRVTKANIQDYYGQKFGTLSKLAGKKDIA